MEDALSDFESVFCTAAGGMFTKCTAGRTRIRLELFNIPVCSQYTDALLHMSHCMFRPRPPLLPSGPIVTLTALAPGPWDVQFHPLGTLPPRPWRSPFLLILLQVSVSFLSSQSGPGLLSTHSDHHMCGFLSFVWLVEKLPSAFFMEWSFPRGGSSRLSVSSYVPGIYTSTWSTNI